MGQTQSSQCQGQAKEGTDWRWKTNKEKGKLSLVLCSKEGQQLDLPSGDLLPQQALLPAATTPPSSLRGFSTSYPQSCFMSHSQGLIQKIQGNASPPRCSKPWTHSCLERIHQISLLLLTASSFPAEAGKLDMEVTKSSPRGNRPDLAEPGFCFQAKLYLWGSAHIPTGSHASSELQCSHTFPKLSY